MPRERITELTPALLAMTWKSESACKTFLNLRGSSPAKLECTIGLSNTEGVCLIPNKGVAVEAAADPFEAYAEALDALLQAAKEEPVADAIIRAHMDAGRSPHQAVDVIVAERVKALEEAPDAPAPAKKAKAKAPAKKKAAAPATTPANDAGENPTPPPAVYPLEEKLRASLAQSEPVPAPAVEPVTPGVKVEAGQLLLRIEEGFDVGESFAGLGARLAKQTGFTFVAVTEAGEVKFRWPGKQASAKGPRQTNTLPTIVTMLERPNGASGAEIQAALHWDNVPGPWFFRHWATKAKRSGDLVELGREPDKSYRYRLQAAA